MEWEGCGKAVGAGGGELTTSTAICTGPGVVPCEDKLLLLDKLDVSEKKLTRKQDHLTSIYIPIFKGYVV